MTDKKSNTTAIPAPKREIEYELDELHQVVDLANSLADTLKGRLVPISSRIKDDDDCEEAACAEDCSELCPIADTIRHARFKLEATCDVIRDTTNGLEI